MKLISCFLLLLLNLQSTDLDAIRKLYPNASQRAESAQNFQDKLANFPDVDSNNVISAYKGAAETLKSKFANKVGEKMKLMKGGAKLIDAAVSAEPDNVEIRMIRLSVQENVPKIVNYRKNITEDKAVLLAKYKSAGSLKGYISNFMLGSKSFSEQEKAAIK